MPTLSLCFALSALSFCTARLNGSLAADGSASLSVAMALEPKMTALIRRISAAGGQTNAQANSPILDSQAIIKSMSKTPGITEFSLKNTGPAAVEGSLRVSKVSELAAADNRRFITFEQGASGGRCVININRGNSSAILALFSPDIMLYLNAIMAPIATREDLSKTEYLDLVSSFYSKEISDEIAASKIRASIDFPGPVKRVKGGTFSGKNANFDIPLIDLLVLESPLSYEVSWGK